MAAFEAALGREHVSGGDDAAVLAASRTTFATTARILGILRPASADEVRACVHIANEKRAALYPISRGLNWGYGSRVPPRDALLLDLSRMNRVLDYDEDLAYATIEPGVTITQLAEFLRERGSRLAGTAHGGPGAASVLGHVLDRGLGKGPYADRWLAACGFEVILGDGSVVHTGYSRFAGAACAPLARAASGPAIDGLFSQSNLGIVTSMTVWLVPLAEHAASFVFAVRDHERMERVVDTLRVLKLEGTLRSTCLLANDVRRLAFGGQYPWEAAGGVTPLPRATREKLRRGISWTGDGALYCPTVARLSADRGRVRALLEPLVEDIVWSDEPSRAGSPIPAGVIERVHALNTGTPLERTAASTYWRKRTPPPVELDPDRDGCGFISIGPTIPYSGRHARAANELLEGLFESYAFDPNIGMNCVSERVIDMTPMIVYDRDVPGEDERAVALHDATLEAFAERGYHPFRLCSRAMDKVAGPRDDYDAFLSKVKLALDPNGVISPGRYERRPRDGR